MLHGTDSPEQIAAAETEFDEMQETIKAELLTRSRNITDLWATRAMQKRTLVAVGVQVFNQFTGVNGGWLWILRLDGD